MSVPDRMALMLAAWAISCPAGVMTKCTLPCLLRAHSRSSTRRLRRDTRYISFRSSAERDGTAPSPAVSGTMGITCTSGQPVRGAGEHPDALDRVLPLGVFLFTVALAVPARHE